MNTTPERILVRGVNWLGDAVMSTPALLRLREMFPGAHVTLLTPEKLRDLWPHHPAVNETITFEDEEGLWSVSRKLRKGRFDLALVLPNSPRSAIETWFAGIPKRIGLARPWRNFFLTTAVAPREGVKQMRKKTEADIRKLIAPRASRSARRTKYSLSDHHIYDYLHLVGALGANPEALAPRLAVTDDEVEFAAMKFGLNEARAAGRPIFGLNPGAEYGPAKRWPVLRFINAARKLQEQTNCVWLLFGGSRDVELAEQIRLAIQNFSSDIRNLAGETSLRELMALLKLCRVLVTNDTGPMHVAAAVGTPVVVPFGSTSPELTGPGLPGDPRNKLFKANVVCSPCFLRTCPIDFRCMDDIGTDEVVKGVMSIVGQAVR